LDKYIVINETKRDGFKVTSYIENLSVEERKKRDNQLSQTAIKLLNAKSSNPLILEQMQKKLKKVEPQSAKSNNKNIYIEEDEEDIEEEFSI